MSQSYEVLLTYGRSSELGLWAERGRITNESARGKKKENK